MPQNIILIFEICEKRELQHTFCEYIRGSPKTFMLYLQGKSLFRREYNKFLIVTHIIHLSHHISQLWEESQSENRRLRLENNALKLELQTTKTQLELAVQVNKKSKYFSLTRFFFRDGFSNWQSFNY